MMAMHLIPGLAAALVAVTLLAAPEDAQALQPATGKVILTMTGKVGDANKANAAEFDLAMLEKLPQRSFTTLLRDVLAVAKAEGVTIKAMALNDYQTSIPFADTKKFDVVLAHKMNGESIPVKTKGPLFIVYPYDTNKELQSSVYYERSAWQLKSLSID